MALEAVQRKWGDDLLVDRPPNGTLVPDLVRDAVSISRGEEKVMVLVCLPPS